MLSTSPSAATPVWPAISTRPLQALTREQASLPVAVLGAGPVGLLLQHAGKGAAARGSTSWRLLWWTSQVRCLGMLRPGRDDEVRGSGRVRMRCP